MSSSLVPHPSGSYSYLPGIAPYSSGVVASPNFEIVHVTLQHSVEWRAGMLAARSWLEARGLECQALCGVELRCPEPHSLGSFSSFNVDYRALLEEWDMLVEGDNPVARTNVSPVVHAPAETQLHGFSFVQAGANAGATFVVAGGGELPHRDLERKHIVRVAETSTEAMLEKAQCVLRIMRHRLDHLNEANAPLSTIDVYTAHPLHAILAEAVVPALPEAATKGIHWHYARPPVLEIEFEMDMRGVQQELAIDLNALL